ncbi:MAG TPA: ATP-binding protein, partial [Azospira sp.]|nr:ATP-binding protein [Azospira sp.]
KMLGYQAAEIVDRQTPAIIHLRAEVEARGRFLSAELGEVVTGFDVFVTMPRRFGSESREWTYVRKDGSHLTVNLVVTTVRGEDGIITGYLGVATDISERKAAEAELRRHRDHLQDLVDERTADLLLAKEAAERANEAKSEFLANISHELRTPLHSILSFATLGGERAKGGQQDKLAHYFERVQQSGSRLLALVNDLLELSKLEAGKMRIEPMPQDVAALVREVAGEIEALAGERRVRIEILPTAIETTAAIDGKRIGQVVRNVLSNAVKYSPVGGVVRVSFADARLARGRRASDATEVAALAIEVRDAGVGIPESELETIFDKFVQSTRTNTGAGGTGLGLSISREIVLAHRGSIRACNNPDGGASFIVVLPRQAPPIH